MSLYRRKDDILMEGSRGGGGGVVKTMMQEEIKGEREGDGEIRRYEGLISYTNGGKFAY